MIERTYKCNLCRDPIKQDSHVGFGGVGLFWSSHPAGWIEKPWRDVETHLCFRCFVSIQDIKQYCIGGFECKGGLKCTSDHK